MVAVVALAGLGISPAFADGNEVAERLVSQYAPDGAANAGVRADAGAFHANVGGTQIEVARDAATVEVSDHSGSASLIALPDLDTGKGTDTGNGTIAYEVEDGTVLLTQPLEDAAVRMSVVIDDPDQPTEYRFDVVPDGGRAEIAENIVLIFDSADEFIGALEEPWAVDSAGSHLLTHYALRDGLVVQIVEHSAANQYPVVADPLFRRGIIKTVEREAWSTKGGYEVSLRVTTAARVLWLKPTNWNTIYKNGLADLREHYPRSMNKATMAQQWNCHVVGLFGTFKIDLEGWRTSKPNWAATEIKKAVQEAVKKKDPRAVSRACNW